MKIQTKNIPIKGMHCKSCTLIVAEELGKIPGVEHVNVNLKTGIVAISYSREPSDDELERAIDATDYIIGVDSKPFFSHDKSVYIAVVFSLVWIVIFFLVFQRLGFTGIDLNGLTSDKGILALAVGVTAGFSTCMALVGGLVLGLSSRYAEKHQNATIAQRFRPHLFFNLGRIVTFFILGGLIGIFGSVFRLDSSVTGILTIIIGFVMIVLGLQLTELFPRLTNKSITLPTGVAKFFGIHKRKQKEYSHRNAMVLGGLTFFLPCGFTQAMQLVAIGSGSFITGSIVMGLFAIGTAPGLLGVGGLTSVVKGKPAKKLFRFAGTLVIILALFNLSTGLNLLGYNFSFDGNQQKTQNINSTNQKQPSGSTQQIGNDPIILSTVFSPSRTSPVDIQPNTFEVKTGQQYVLEIVALEDGQGCMSTIMIPGVYRTPLLITKGLIKLPFKIDKAGKYNITCAMGVVRGTITATDGGSK